MTGWTDRTSCRSNSKGTTVSLDLDRLGLVDDGSTTEVMVYDVKAGHMEQAVLAFQEAFADFRPSGFSVVFAAADVAHERLTWVHRYDEGFDLTQRFYLGKYPQLVHCLWAGTRFDAVMASSHGVVGGTGVSSEYLTLDQLAEGPTVELKVYQVKQGHWDEFLSCWRSIVKLREAAGFKVEFAVADVPGHRFVWGVSIDGDFDARNSTYLTGDDRRAANVISDHIERFEIPRVVYIPIA